MSSTITRSSFFGLAMALLLAPPDSWADSTMGLSINGYPVANNEQATVKAINKAFDALRIASTTQNKLLEDETPWIPKSRQEFDQILALLRDPDTKRDQVPKGFRGLQGLSWMQAVWIKEFGGRARLKGRLIDYAYDRVNRSGWLTFATRIDWYETRNAVGDEVDPQFRSTSRDYFRWFIEILPDGFEIIKRIDIMPAVEGGADRPVNPQLGAIGTQPFPGMQLDTLAIDPADSRSVWQRGLTHKLLARGGNFIIRGVFHKQGNDGPLLRLPEEHPFYDRRTRDLKGEIVGETPARCLDIMFRGEPPESHLPEQLGWCFGMCTKNNIAVINSNGD